MDSLTARQSLSTRIASGETTYFLCIYFKAASPTTCLLVEHAPNVRGLAQRKSFVKCVFLTGNGFSNNK